jgi:predicted metal-dependent hydrolase
MKTLLLILFFILLTYFLYKLFINDEDVYVKSTIDNRKYMIRNGNKDKKYLQDSANTLAIINQKIEKLLKHLEKNYDMNNEKNIFIYKLIKNYNPELLSEAANDIRFTTFTINKQDMHICLRTRDDNENIYNIDILMYVVLHELAHFCNYDKNGEPILGHGKEFKYIFQVLVKEAIKIGIYNYIDFKKEPKEYCGIVINSTIV